MWYVLMRIVVAQMVMSCMLIVASFMLFSNNYVADICIAFVLVVCYSALGMLCIVTLDSVRRLVVRQVFRTLFIGILLVVVPLIILERISLVTLVSFAIIHILCWWWIFGRRRSSIVHRQLSGFTKSYAKLSK